ncbi:hypothetical protein D9758_014980 [Tetrapyrgos nigripes]|uniref:Choline dehydrogenase n=1 Tax=Tetrapyrgos nigripes TaxID=182062 RepID=A0A8H5CEB8_9AGAR|nr:hypothetical protein D9758_014980 [Tetrapyrgos nigripes]
MTRLRLKLFSFLSLSLLTLQLVSLDSLLVSARVASTNPNPNLPQCSDIRPQGLQDRPQYDYVVVGSGAGGGPLASRLAEEGFSVLVFDAGHDVNNLNTTIPLYFARASDDPQLDLNYTVSEYPEGFRFQKNDAWYPRALEDSISDLEGTSSEEGREGRLVFALDTVWRRIRIWGALPVASNFDGKEESLEDRVERVLVRKEVIVSAGVFQSPQLLMLSGIGNSSHLEEHAIEPVVHLPGVGNNLQDHDEIAMIFQTKGNFSFFNGCTFLSDPEEDPCLEYWKESGGKNVYSFSALDVITSTSPRGEDSSEAPSPPDILSYFGPFYFPGFVRGYPQLLANKSHNSITAIALKAHPSSLGTVRLSGSHPQDILQIHKNRFQDADRGYQDVVDLREALKRIRKLIRGSVLIGPYVEKEIAPGEDVESDEEIEEYIYRNVFGHHACCTNAIGPDDDDNAVLDGNFKVRGVNNLRVVDASSWPNVPGFFITTPIYMISEKAADVIIDEARRSQL